MARYYYMKDGKKEGPIAADDLFYDLRDGHLPRDTQVCADDSAAWIPFSALPDSVFSQKVIDEARDMACAQIENQKQASAKWGASQWGAVILVIITVVLICARFAPEPYNAYNAGYADGADSRRTSVNAGHYPASREEAERVARELSTMLALAKFQESEYGSNNQVEWIKGFRSGYLTAQPSESLKLPDIH